ncbi:MAG: 50S ribosomal protein L19e [Nitrososphaerales archaeon]|jgi:large subunit ribosomal protein L19e|nr:50S ribosomal protein L19e [Nitrososphaerales archaeon]|tara:strand:- start:2056 stop:2493 length:438 start_codon:yes stop_codon:yes gene_type:complete
MNLSVKKRMAADVLKVGKKRVKFDPESTDDIFDAITRESIRGLASSGVISVKPKKGISRGRARKMRIKIKKRGVGAGSKEGAKGARRGKKSIWINKVRSLRGRLKVRRDRGEISGKIFNEMYRQIKGGHIRSLKHLESILKQYKK